MPSRTGVRAVCRAWLRAMRCVRAACHAREAGLDSEDRMRGAWADHNGSMGGARCWVEIAVQRLRDGRYSGKGALRDGDPWGIPWDPWGGRKVSGDVTSPGIPGAVGRYLETSHPLGSLGRAEGIWRRHIPWDPWGGMGPLTSPDTRFYSLHFYTLARVDTGVARARRTLLYTITCAETSRGTRSGSACGRIGPIR